MYLSSVLNLTIEPLLGEVFRDFFYDMGTLNAKENDKIRKLGFTDLLTFIGWVSQIIGWVFLYFIQSIRGSPLLKDSFWLES